MVALGCSTVASDAWNVPIGSGVWHIGDTFDVMRTLPSASVDMILCDLPYGTTQNKWDSVLPLDQLWAEYWRIAKPNAAIVLTAQPPFDKLLGASCLQHMKYEWIWEKTEATGHLNAKKQPMKCHENILVFYRQQSTYNPEMTQGHPVKITQRSARASVNYGSQRPTSYESDQRYPRSVLQFAKDNKNAKIHPTQKPVDLFSYMIRTYTNPGDTVLDNTAGSGTTAVAAEQSGRRWICIERDEEYSLRAIARLGKLPLQPCADG
jgi:site-specific DNA-methyltransferase (adenine-specific)